MLQQELRLLEKELENLKQQLSNLPPEKVYIAKNGAYHRWYQTDGHISTYIPKSNKEHIQQLALKKILSLKYDYLEKEYQILKKCLTSHQKNPKKDLELLEQYPSYVNDLKSNSYRQITSSQSWNEESFEKNTSYPEQLIFPSPSKNILRSKSEYMIDTALFSAGIAFRYECKLTINEIQFFPDFTIFLPHQQKLIYWEHFGMMDNPDYANKALHKLKFFTENGLILNQNLIVTFETSKFPLTYGHIEGIISGLLSTMSS